MMRETFRHKKRGDHLFHQEVNRLFDSAQRAVLRRPGSNVLSHYGVEATFDPWHQSIAEISEALGAGLYRCKLRYYDADAGAWASQDDEWDLDAHDLGLSFSVGDRVPAFWDDQRGAFIPTASHAVGGLSSVWSGFLQSNLDLVKTSDPGTSSQAIPWTQLDVDGQGITHSAPDDVTAGNIVLVEAARHDLHFNISFSPNEDDWSICEFNMQFRLDGVTIWRKNIDGESKLGGAPGEGARNCRGFAHRFKTTTANQVLTIVVSNQDELDLRLDGNALASRPRCDCSVARIR